jgi:hypothetical protein
MTKCKYEIKDTCAKEEISFEICNACVHITLFHILEAMVLVGKNDIVKN